MPQNNHEYKKVTKTNQSQQNLIGYLSLLFEIKKSINPNLYAKETNNQTSAPRPKVS